MNRNTFLFVVIALGLTSLLSACGSSSKPAPQIAVAIATAPPAELEINLSTPLSAVVTNDSASAGVTWTLSCAADATCGTLSASSSASGATINYTAPSSIPADDLPSLGVTITATSVTDSTKSAITLVGITPVSQGVSDLTGEYAFYLSGIDVNGNLYSAAGSLSLDGAGDASGEEDYNNANGITSLDDTVSGSYTVGEDGQGQISLTVSDVNVGVGGTQTLAITLVNYDHLLITQFDGSATSSGSFDLQTLTTAGDLTQISGGYSFTFSGNDNDPGEGLEVLGGVATADGNGNLNGLTIDENIAGSTFFGLTTPATFTAPDADGRGILTFTTYSLNFAYYIVGPEVFRIVEIDPTIEAVGSFYGQGANAGSITDATLTGPLVFSEAGNSIFGALGAAGLLNADGNGNFTAGYADVNEGDGSPTTGALTTGTYSIGTNGYGSATLTLANTPDLVTFGVYAVDPALNVSDPNNTADGFGGALLLDLDTNDFGAGAIMPQDASYAFVGNYGFNQQVPYVADIVGQTLSDGVSNLTGSGQQNDLFGFFGPAGQNMINITATFTPDAINAGRYTVITAGTNPENLAAYQATNGQLFFVETDASLVSYGVVEGQQ